MLTCEETIEFLSPYRDGELAAADRAAVESHLSGCEACRAYLRDLTDLGAILSDERFPAIPHDLASRVVEACAHSGVGHGRANKGRWRLWVAAAAGFALYLLGYLGVVSYVGNAPARSVAEARQWEQILHDSRLAFAGAYSEDVETIPYEQRPETRLLFAAAGSPEP